MPVEEKSGLFLLEDTNIDISIVPSFALNQKDESLKLLKFKGLRPKKVK